jgi:hypothetical protein
MDPDDNDHKEKVISPSQLHDTHQKKGTQNENMIIKPNSFSGIYRAEGARRLAPNN